MLIDDKEYKLNLQLFAKDGPGGEKTEEPTAKKLEDARKEGNVAKSKEIVTAVGMLASFYIIKAFIGDIGYGFMDLYRYIFNMIPTYVNPYHLEISYNAVYSILIDMVLMSVKLVWHIMLVGFAITIIGYLLQVKWKVTTKPLKPKFSKINPVSGFKRVFSKQSLVNLFKSLALIIIIGYVVYSTMKDEIYYWYRWYDVSLITAIAKIGDLALGLAIKISGIYIIVGVADFIWQKRKFHNDMMMTKQEVKDELKNSEGDPQVKSQQRRVMQKASMRRMMQSVPDADVVITNPTHFAVALKYDLKIAGAPVVVAKGADYVAQKIKDKAREAQVEIVENKPLARALYANVEIGQEIPEELYQAVAEVLAFVYNIKNKKA